MAVSELQLDLRLIETVGTPPISKCWRKPSLKYVGESPENGEFVDSRFRQRKVFCGTCPAASREEGMSAGVLPEFLCQHTFLSEPPDSWSECPAQHPVFSHRNHSDTLWLNNWYRPAWVTKEPVQLHAPVDVGMKKPPESVSNSIQGHAGRVGPYATANLEVATCTKLCHNGQAADAVDSLDLLVQRGRRIPDDVFYILLKRCIAEKDLVLGRRVHTLIVESGYGGSAFLATQLIGLYASHGNLEDAMRVFSQVTPPSAYNWAAIILAYAKHGQPMKAIGLYRQMRDEAVKPHNRIFVAVLKACASAEDLAAGKDVHAHVRGSEMKPDMFVQNSLVHMYAKCGSLEDARRLFDGLPERDVVTWNAMITGYAQHGMGQEAHSLYSAMQQEGLTLPDSITYISLLQACANEGVASLQHGRQLHAQIEERGLQADVVLGNSLVNMYAKCGSLEDAQRLFDRFTRKTVVTWNTMIGGYAQQGRGQEALSLYNRMQQENITPPNSVTFICLLQACARVAALQQGRDLHAQIEARGLQSELGNSLVCMYAKCGSLEDARKVFDSLSQRDVVTWTAMISGYVLQGKGREALSLYSSMLQEHVTPLDSVTFVCLLQACAGVGATALEQGKQLHAQIEELGVQFHVVVGASLVNMYAKCGSLEDGRITFDRLPKKDVVTWNAMIAGYTNNGMGQEAFNIFSSMQQEGITPPNSVTFTCLLQACANEGVAALQQGRLLHTEIEERGLQADVAVGDSLANMYNKCGSSRDAQNILNILHQKDSVTGSAM